MFVLREIRFRNVDDERAIHQYEPIRKRNQNREDVHYLREDIDAYNTKAILGLHDSLLYFAAWRITLEH